MKSNYLDMENTVFGFNPKNKKIYAYIYLDIHNNLCQSMYFCGIVQQLTINGINTGH